MCERVDEQPRIASARLLLSSRWVRTHITNNLRMILEAMLFMGTNFIYAGSTRSYTGDITMNHFSSERSDRQRCSRTGKCGLEHGHIVDHNLRRTDLYIVRRLLR